MNYGRINKCDIANGEGIRLTLFVSGCRNRCKNCFQPETWSFDYGAPITDEVAEDWLSKFPGQIGMFAEYPEDWEERVAKYAEAQKVKRDADGEESGVDKKASEELETVKAELQAEKEENATLKAELESAKALLAEAEAKVAEKSEDDAVIANEELEKAKAEIAELKEENAKLKTDNRALKAANTRLKKGDDAEEAKEDADKA